MDYLVLTRRYVLYHKVTNNKYENIFFV